MSARDAATVGAGDPPVRIESGMADVFLVCADGTRLPVATVDAGAVVPGPGGSPTLAVVPRIDASINGHDACAGSNGTNGTNGTNAGHTDGDGVGQFLAALAVRIGADRAAPLTTTPPGSLPDALASALD